MHRVKSTMLALIAGTAALFLPTHCEADPGDESDQLVSVARQYHFNRSGFEFLTCRFVITEGYSSVIDRNLKASEIEEAVEAHGLWVVDGDRELLDVQLEESAPPREAMTDIASATVADAFKINTVQFLGNSDFQFRMASTNGNGMVHSHDRPAPGLQFTPFVFCVMGRGEMLSPDRMIADPQISQQFRSSYQGTEMIEGDLVDIVRFRQPLVGSRVFKLDRERGALPVEIVLTHAGKDRPFSAIYLTDMISCSSDRWFPRRFIRFSYMDEPGRYPVREYRIQELDVDNRPDEDLFALALEAGLVVDDGDVRSTPFVIKDSRQLTLASLPELHQQVTTPARGMVRQLAGSVFATENTVLLIAGLALLAVLLLRWLPRRLKRAA